MSDSDMHVSLYTPGLLSLSSSAKRHSPLESVYDAESSGHIRALLDVSQQTSKLRHLAIVKRWTLLGTPAGRLDIISSCDSSQHILRSHLEIVAVILHAPVTHTRLEVGARIGRVCGARLALKTTKAFGGIDTATLSTSWNILEGLTASANARLRLDKNSSCSALIQANAKGEIQYSIDVVNRPGAVNGAKVSVGWRMSSLDRCVYPSLHVSFPLDIPPLRLYTRIGHDAQEIGLAFGTITRVNIGAEMSVERGISVVARIRFRLFSACIPVKIADTIEPNAFLLVVVAPIVLYGLWRLIFASSLSEQSKSERNRRLTARIQGLFMRRSTAQAQCDVMRSEAAQIRASEVASNGLVILSASYEVVDLNAEQLQASIGRSPIFATSLDVRVPLQFWVTDSYLELPERSKSKMLGFYHLFDFGKRLPRVLKVKYFFGGEKYFCTIGEFEPVRLPHTSHRVMRANVFG